MNSHPNHQTDDAAANAILIAVGVGLSIVAVHWAAATVATGLRHGRFLRANSKATVESIKLLPKHWRNPAVAWPEPFRSSLPGPVLYWASAVLVVAVLVALTLLVLRFRHPPLEAPDRRRRLGVDVQPRLAKQVELKSLLERTPAPNRLVLAQWNRRDLLLTEPSMIGRRRGVRGAVAVFGPSQSGKTTGPSSA